MVGDRFCFKHFFLCVNIRDQSKLRELRTKRRVKSLRFYLRYHWLSSTKMSVTELLCRETDQPTPEDCDDAASDLESLFNQPSESGKVSTIGADF